MRTVSPDDLTARARLRQAALRLFGQNGFAGTSTRAVAEAAHVSPALVTHHFGSKKGLRAAVDEDVLRRLADGLELAYSKSGTDDVIAELGSSTAQLFGEDEELRNYIRRSLLEGGEAGAKMFGELLSGSREQLARLAAAGVVRNDMDDTWAPLHLLFILLGPLLLEPSITPNVEIDDLFDAKVLADRSATNRRLLTEGILRKPAQE